MDILLASSNTHKLHEFEALMKPHKLHLPSEYGISFDCPEDGSTYYENALQKAEALYSVAKHLNMPILADDSGLTVDALPGELGLHTARFGSKPSEPILPSYEKNCLLLKKLEGIPLEKRTAHFNTVLVFKNGDEIISTEGVAQGHIQTEITNGDGGFGYDPVFYCNEAGCSMATLPDGEKNNYSHRGKAARALLEIINKKENKNGK